MDDSTVNPAPFSREDYAASVWTPPAPLSRIGPHAMLAWGSDYHLLWADEDSDDGNDFFARHPISAEAFETFFGDEAHRKRWGPAATTTSSSSPDTDSRVPLWSDFSQPLFERTRTRDFAAPFKLDTGEQWGALAAFRALTAHFGAHMCAAAGEQQQQHANNSSSEPGINGAEVKREADHPMLHGLVLGRVDVDMGRALVRCGVRALRIAEPRDHVQQICERRRPSVCRPSLTEALQQHRRRSGNNKNKNAAASSTTTAAPDAASDTAYLSQLSSAQVEVVDSVVSFQARVADADVDFVLSLATLPHQVRSVAEMQDAIVRSARLLRPGGIALHTVQLLLTDVDATAIDGVLLAAPPLLLLRVADVERIADAVARSVPGARMTRRQYFAGDAVEDRRCDVADHWQGQIRTLHRVSSMSKVADEDDLSFSTLLTHDATAAAATTTKTLEVCSTTMLLVVEMSS